MMDDLGPSIPVPKKAEAWSGEIGQLVPRLRFRRPARGNGA
jgi:hypothetical protein